MKKLSFIIAGVFLSIIVIAQTPDARQQNKDYIIQDAVLPCQNYDPNSLRVPELKKLKFSISSGMIIGSGGQAQSFSRYYLAPELYAQLTPRWRLRGGVMISNTAFKGYNIFSSEAYSSDQYSSPGYCMTVFAGGDYQVNDRLILTGMLLKDINPANQRELNAAYSNLNRQQWMIGLDYKVTDNFHVGAQILHSKGYSPIMRPNIQPLYSPYPFGIIR